MAELIYIANARMPTEKAHGYQIAKMCEAFGRLGIPTTLIYPFRRQPPSLVGADPISFYQVDPVFTLRQIWSWDASIFDRIQPVRHAVQSITFGLNILRETRPFWEDTEQILYTRSPHVLALLARFRRQIAARIVFEAHAFPEGTRRKDLLLRSARRADRLVVITRHLADLFKKEGIPETQITVAPDAVDVQRFQIKETQTECRRRLNLPSDRFLIGYIGRFRAMGMEKGIPELVQALGRVLLKAPLPRPAMLVCVGGPMEAVPRYRKISAELDIPEDRLLFVDRVPNDQVPYWIRACDVATIPWDWNPFSAYYTSPLKLFEYMAVGTPIVASDLPSLREVLTEGQTAVFSRPGDAESLGRAILRVLSDPELRGRLSQRASQEVLRYTWENRAVGILRDCGVHLQAPGNDSSLQGPNQG